MMKALFLGSKTLGLSVFRCLSEADRSVNWRIIHPHDTADGRSALESFRQFAASASVELSVAPSASATKAMILAARPDIVFVSGWYWLIDNEALAAAPMGFYGIHNSLLPRCRGCAPLVWSIINGDDVVGATVFRFAPGIDDGDILHQVRVPNDPDDNIGTLLRKIEGAMVSTLPAKWKALLDGTATLVAQDHAEATFCGQRGPADGRIDWRQPAPQVHNFIRAQTPPYPGAFSHAQGRKIVFLKTAPDARRYFGTPGQVVERSRNHVVVSCGDNSALHVLDVTLDGVPTPPPKAMPSLSVRLE
jgi:methionyl-tRNA formyltransferase